MFWEVGNTLGISANELTHDNSPLKALLYAGSDVMKSLAEAHLQLEQNVTSALGPDTPIHNLITKDFISLEKGKEQLRNKSKELDRVQSKYRKEKERGEQIKDDYHKNVHTAKEQRLANIARLSLEKP